MAVLIFENATQDQANAFVGATDVLGFSSSSANALNTVFAPVASGDAIGITSGGKTLIFSTQQLRDASAAGRIGFNDSTNIVLGLNTADTGGGALNGGAGNDVVYGFGGGDTINTGNGTNYAFGGSGADSITGGNGADHLYGQSPNGGTDTDPGVVGDTIDGGLGNDYINGNAGEDTIIGNDGSDRIFGGADNDSITGGQGNDTVNGNLGNDTIDGGTENDFLRGGQGNDSLVGGANNDQLLGDLGDDVLRGGANADQVTGGAGADTFVFSTPTDAASDVQSINGSNVTFYDTILDYVDNTDKIALYATGVATLVAVGATSATFAGTQAGINAATVYAQQLLDATTAGAGGEVAAVLVGGDTFLFYNSATGDAGTINSFVKVQGLTTPSVLTATDFIGLT